MQKSKRHKNVKETEAIPTRCQKYLNNTLGAVFEVRTRTPHYCHPVLKKEIVFLKIAFESRK